MPESSLLDRSRERVISEIYETILRPERYDVMMDAWASHLELARDEGVSGNPGRQIAAANFRVDDPELLEHFNRACELIERIGRKGRENPEPSVALSNDIAVMIGPGDTVLEVSRSATALFGRSITVAKICEHLDLSGSQRFLSALANANTAPPDTLLTVVQFIDAEGMEQHAAVTTKQQPGSDEIHVLLKTLALNWGERIDDVLSKVFELSPAEIAVARKLSEGHTLKSISKQRNKSLHTVRSQLKSIMRKTAPDHSPT